MLPLPPLSQFSPSRVYAGHNFFPLADQFLLVPRRFAKALFEAVRLCYDCEALKAQSKSGVPAQTESLLYMVLRGEDGRDDSSSSSSGTIPFGYYEFPVVIVRNNEGGVCDVLHPHKLSCEMLRVSGYAAAPAASAASAGDGDDLLTDFRCMVVMRRWYQRACVEMFPPLDLGTVSSPAEFEKRDADGAGRARVASVEDGRFDAQRQRVAVANRRSEPTGGGELLTFEEATGRVDGIHRDLSDLLGMMRVDVAPAEELRTFFLAHHYPFHRVDPLRRAERGPLDEVAIVEGYRLSEADFSRLTLSFSCFLSATTAALALALAERDRAGEGGAASAPPGPPRQGGVANLGGRGGDSGDDKDTLVLKTTAAEEEKEGLRAVVNCSLVESLHDVWGALLENKFDPSETVCHGPFRPCLERALAEDREN